MATKYFRGGAYTLRGEGDASTDGDFEYDDAGDSYNNSNWVNAAGAGVAAPVDGDLLIFSELADIVPVDYSNAAYPHVVGNHWSVCFNVSQGGMDFQDVIFTRGFTGDVYGYNSTTLDADVAVDKGSGLVGIPITGHPFSVGDYVTLGGTTYFDCEKRVISETANEIVITHEYFVETFATNDTAVGRTPLSFTIQEGYSVVVESNSRIYLECDSGSGGDNIPDLIFNSVSGSLHISSQSADGLWEDILVTRAGTLTVADNSWVTAILITAESTAVVIVGEGVLKDDTSSQPETNLTCHGGTVTWESEIGIIIQSDGKITFCQNALMGTQVDIDSLTLYGGTFNWYGKSTLSNYEQHGGTLNVLGAEDKVIGSGSATAYPQYGGTFNASLANGRVTFGTGDSINHYPGSSFSPAPRNNITW